MECFRPRSNVICANGIKKKIKKFSKIFYLINNHFYLHWQEDGFYYDIFIYTILIRKYRTC